MQPVTPVPLHNFLQKTCFIQMNTGSAEYLLASRILETQDWIPWTTPLHLVASIYSAWNLYPSSFTLCTFNHVATRLVSLCCVTLCSLSKTLNPVAWVATGHVGGWRITRDLSLWQVCLWINRRPWTNSPTPRCYVWLALIRAKGMNGTWVMCP
jgi:hypothetical protein